MKYDNRKYVLFILFILVGIIFIIRLAGMQLFTNKWQNRATEITEKKIDIYAPRGIIFDREGRKLVENRVYYELLATPNEINEFDTVHFCNTIGITKEDFIARIEKIIEDYDSRAVPGVFIQHLSQEEFEKIEDVLYEFRPAFFERARTERFYPYPVAPHVLGYVSMVSKEDRERDSYFKLNDQTGVSGLEKFYEKELRGRRGTQYLIKSAVGNDMGSLDGGIHDVKAINGSPLISTLDAELQLYAEKLMENKVGAIIAIEPETGEILVSVSSPGYDPNKMTLSQRNKYYSEIAEDTMNLLFNKAISSEYPPGSTFKLIQAIVGMDMGVITPQSSFVCDGSLIGDHIAPGVYQMRDAVKSSSNQWFLLAMKKMVQQGKFYSHFKDAPFGLMQWHSEMSKYNFGKAFPLDIEGSKPGLLPDTSLYNRIHGKGRWAYSTIRSISIGQGEVQLTPLHIANMGCVLANRGYYYYPHFVKSIGKDGPKDIYRRKIQVSDESTNYFPVIDAMQAVVDEAGGTARLARIPDIAVCAKTGTVENKKGEDHSVFLAFAPRENPKIVVSVYVENAGFGGLWAGPIASLIMEKYLTGKISDPKKEKRILEKDFINPEK